MVHGPLALLSKASSLEWQIEGPESTRSGAAFASLRPAEVVADYAGEMGAQFRGVLVPQIPGAPLREEKLEIRGVPVALQLAKEA